MSRFRIVAAQSSSVPGDIAENARRHARVAALAKRHEAHVVIFPELSLTGYEETLASQIAISNDSDECGCLQQVSDELELAIVAGCPIRSGGERPYIGAFIFSPGKGVEVYRKRYLHPGEEKYFVASDETMVCQLLDQRVGIAICADIQQPEHPAAASALQVTIYAAGVAMTPKGIGEAETRMAKYARDYGMLTVMANYASDTGGYAMAGRSAAWNPCGELLAQAPDRGECLVVAALEDDGWRGWIAS